MSNILPISNIIDPAFRQQTITALKNGRVLSLAQFKGLSKTNRKVVEDVLRNANLDFDKVVLEGQRGFGGEGYRPEAIKAIGESLIIAAEKAILAVNEALVKKQAKYDLRHYFHQK